jgi:regulation of enolase protein 1 (concanavalin A-like superfamily)
MVNLLAADSPGAMKWMNEPSDWRLRESALEVRPDAGTDFWQRTHYGFRNDNGHLYHAELGGDFDLRVRVIYRPVHQYDQAGLMAYFSPDNWIKCSVEGEIDEPFRLGAVVTRDGYSDWSTQDLDADRVDVEFRLARTGHDFTAWSRQAGVERWTQMRLAHLPGGAAKAGLYACSPKEAGFSARFSGLILA